MDSGRSNTHLSLPLAAVAGFGVGIFTMFCLGHTPAQIFDQFGTLQKQVDEVRINLLRLDTRIQALPNALSIAGDSTGIGNTNVSSQVGGKIKVENVIEEVSQNLPAKYAKMDTPLPQAALTDTEEQLANEIINKFQAEYTSRPDASVAGLMTSEDVRDLSPAAQERVLQKLLRKLNAGEIVFDLSTKAADN